MIDLEKGLKKYDVTLHDLKRLKVTLYEKQDFVFIKYTGEVFGSLAGIYIDHYEVERKLEAAKKKSKPVTPREKKEKKDKKDWPGYDPKRPSIDD